MVAECSCVLGGARGDLVFDRSVLDIITSYQVNQLAFMNMFVINSIHCFITNMESMKKIKCPPMCTVFSCCPVSDFNFLLLQVKTSRYISDFSLAAVRV